MAPVKFFPPVLTVNLTNLHFRGKLTTDLLELLQSADTKLWEQVLTGKDTRKDLEYNGLTQDLFKLFSAVNILYGFGFTILACIYLFMYILPTERDTTNRLVWKPSISAVFSVIFWWGADSLKISGGSNLIAGLMFCFTCISLTLGAFGLFGDDSLFRDFYSARTLDSYLNVAPIGFHCRCFAIELSMCIPAYFVFQYCGFPGLLPFVCTSLYLISLTISYAFYPILSKITKIPVFILVSVAYGVAMTVAAKNLYSENSMPFFAALLSCLNSLSWSVPALLISFDNAGTFSSFSSAMTWASTQSTAPETDLFHVALPFWVLQIFLLSLSAPYRTIIPMPYATTALFACLYKFSSHNYFCLLMQMFTGMYVLMICKQMEYFEDSVLIQALNLCDFGPELYALGFGWLHYVMGFLFQTAMFMSIYIALRISLKAPLPQLFAHTLVLAPVFWFLALITFHTTYEENVFGIGGMLHLVSFSLFGTVYVLLFVLVLELFGEPRTTTGEIVLNLMQKSNTTSAAIVVASILAVRQLFIVQPSTLQAFAVCVTYTVLIVLFSCCLNKKFSTITVTIVLLYLGLEVYNMKTIAFMGCALFVHLVFSAIFHIAKCIGDKGSRVLFWLVSTTIFGLVLIKAGISLQEHLLTKMQHQNEISVRVLEFQIIELVLPELGRFILTCYKH